MIREVNILRAKDADLLDVAEWCMNKCRKTDMCVAYKL